MTQRMTQWWNDWTACECNDRLCPVHPGFRCGRVLWKRKADVFRLFRIDAAYDVQGTEFCRDCAVDALETGLYTEEPN